MGWIKERFKEKSTYIGIATIVAAFAKDFIPLPFASELIELAAGAVLFAVHEQKK